MKSLSVSPNEIQLFNPNPSKRCGVFGGIVDYNKENSYLEGDGIILVRMVNNLAQAILMTIPSKTHKGILKRTGIDTIGTSILRLKPSVIVKMTHNFSLSYSC